jgi:hypothetical protein
MVGKTVAVAALFLASLVAGCVSGPAEPGPARSRPAEEGAVAALGGRFAEPVSASADAAAGGDEAEAAATAPAAFQVAAQSDAAFGPWYLAAMEVPEGTTPLAGFHWTVPEGAILESKEYDGFEAISLEVALLLPEGGELESYSVSWFSLAGRDAELVSLHLGVPVDVTVKTTPVLQDAEHVPVSTDPYLALVAGDFSEGDVLGIVLSAQGSATAVGLAFRVLDEHLFDGDVEPAGDAARFLEGVQAQGDGVALATVGRGAGFQFAAYLDINVGTFGFEVQSGPVEVVDRLPTEAARPAVTARDATIASTFKPGAGADGGWGLAMALYWGDIGAASWELAGSVHGRDVQESGVLVAPATGLMLVMVTGGEEPDSSLALDLRVANVDQIEILEFLTLDYGASISTLLGASTPASETSSWSAAPARPHTRGGDLVVPLAGGVDLQLVGAAPARPES